MEDYMNTNDIEAAHSLCDTIEDTLTIEFVSVGDDISDDMGEILRVFLESVPCLQLKTKKNSDQDDPFIRIQDNIRFKARPSEKLLDLFIDILSLSMNPDPFIRHLDVEGILAPVFLKVYVAPFCPHCPNVVKALVPLALASDLIHIDIIDGTLFSRKAEADSIMAAPTVICDDRHRWSGPVAAQEILDIILNRKPEELSSHTLKTMIEAGNAARLADMMVQANKVFPSFYDLLTHEKWPVRLGAMVTVQTIHELKPVLSDLIIHALWVRFQHFPETVKGDVIYLTGEVAPGDYCDKLRVVLESGLSDDLREAVEDALETMSGRESH